MHKIMIAALVLFVALSQASMAQVKITNGDGASIDDIIRDKSLATIVLKGNVRDANLTITGINENTITFQTSDGDHSAYPLTMISEISIQEQRVASKKQVFTLGSLTREEKQIVDRAAARAFEIFRDSQGNQEMRMAAAGLMASTGSEDALMYLRGLAEGNDTPTSVAASLTLYSIGEKVDPNIVQEGFLNGNRLTRTQAAVLAGLSGETTNLRELREMLTDPSELVYPFAARALAKLNDRESLPSFYKALSSLKQERSEAAVYALITLGGDDVIKELNAMLPSANSSTWIRIIRVLYALGDEDAAVAMRKQALTTVSYDEVAGLLLGENDDWEGVMWIREHLDKPSDPDYVNLVYHAHLATALYNTAQAQAKIVFQKLMRLNESQIYAKGYTDNVDYKKETVILVQLEVCRMLGIVGDKSMLSLLTGAIESSDPRLALAASGAAINISMPGLRDRSIETTKYLGYREAILYNVFK